MSHVDFVDFAGKFSPADSGDTGHPNSSTCPEFLCVFFDFFREEPPAMNTASALPCPSRAISKVESPTNKNCPGHGLKYFIQTAINLRGCSFRLTIVYHGNAIC